jgi:hypothetical protein
VRLATLVAATAALALAALAATVRADVTDQEVQQAISAAMAKLKAGQKADGAWEDTAGRTGGVTALATLALLQAGEPLQSAAVEKALAALAALPDADTYVVSLRMMAFLRADQAAGRPLHEPAIRAAVAWLAKAQSPLGAWGYDAQAPQAGDQRLATDNSNTQMALLALYEAARAGYKASDELWRRSEDYFARTQMADGGWVYRFQGPTVQESGPSYGSMTAAGLATLFITGDRFAQGQEWGWDAQASALHCGQYRQAEPMARAQRWLEQHYTVASNPGLSGVTWHYYYLYTLERAALLSGRKFIGTHDWFREGAEMLVRRQRDDGSFERTGGRSGPTAEYDTAFALLFLAKGHVPILVNKLRWGAGDADWNNDRYDAEHLTRWTGQRLNGRPVTWQTVPVEAPVQQWLEAPILYITGHKAPKFTDEQKKKLRRYVELGGTILAEACCNRPEFAAGLRQTAAEIFPESKLEILPPDHPVYHSFQPLPPDWPLEGVTLGCRTAFFLSPRDLSCYWEQDAQPQSEAAMKMGLNIAAYATARQPLRQRLAAIELADQLPKVALEPGALYVAKIIHQGDWNSRPLALDLLLDDLRRDSAVKVANRAVPLLLTDDRLMKFPVIYLVGHYDPQLSAAEKARLKTYLERGGFLFAEACCGMPAFDAAFHKLMAELFPDAPLETIPPTSPLLNGQVGFKIGRVAFSPRLAEEQPALAAPRLEGLKLGGRYAVIYSPYAIGPGLDRIATWQARGYQPEDAHRLAVNILLYALRY